MIGILRVQQHAKQADSVALGLELRGVPPATERRAHRYRDSRLGFEIESPAGWDQRDLTPPELSASGTFVRWSQDGRWVGVLAHNHADPALDQTWLGELLEQLLRDQVGPISRGAVTDGDRTLAAQPTRHVTWNSWLQRVDGLITRRGRTLYALLVVDRDDEVLNLAAERFVLIP